MDFIKIVSHAWDIIKKNRYLWWLGILAACAEGGGSRISGSGNLSDLFNNSKNTTPTNTNHLPITNSTSELIHKMPRVLGDSTISPTPTAHAETLFRSWMDWASHNVHYLVIIIGVLILLYVLIVYVSNSARAGLILSINNIETNKEKLNFGSAFRAGQQFAWRLFGLNLYIGLIILGFLIIVTLPLIIALSAHAATGITVLAGIIFFLGFLALIVLCIYLSVALKFAARALVLNDIRITEAFRRSRVLLKNQLKNSLFTWLIDLAIGVVISLALAIAAMVVIALLVGLGFVFYAAAHESGVIVYSIIVGLAFLALMIIVGGIYTSFISTYWTLSYRAIDYLEKKSRA